MHISFFFKNNKFKVWKNLLLFIILSNTVGVVTSATALNPRSVSPFPWNRGKPQHMAPPFWNYNGQSNGVEMFLCSFAKGLGVKDEIVWRENQLNL